MSSASNPIYVVGIGASAGGLKPLELFFQATPLQTGCAFVVVQHLAPDYKSLMQELLFRQTAIPVVKAEDGEILEADKIYLPPPGTHVILDGMALKVTPLKPEPRGATRIDDFLSSIAHLNEHAIAVILSGSGRDGSEGAVNVFKSGGAVFCQDPETAQFDSMPCACIARHCASAVLPPDQIPAAILDFVKNPQNPIYNTHQPPQVLDPLFTTLKEHLGIDFSGYKLNTIRRRIARRMKLHGESELDQYIEKVIDDPKEIDALYHDILIGVTQFFRDSSAFDALRNAARNLMQSKKIGEDVRVWCAGCATGQEAYSLAFLLSDLAVELHFQNRITIYATDAHRGSLAKASTAIYLRDDLKGFEPSQIDRFFNEISPDTFKVKDPFRRMVVFAPHNLLADPPFPRIDLISCRNVLIYLEPKFQTHLLKRLNFALTLKGLLFLAPSEDITGLNAFFAPIDNRAKIFKKTGHVSELPNSKPPPLSAPARHEAPEPTSSFSHTNTRISRHLLNSYDAILSNHLPAGLIVTEDGEILHFFGNAQEYLKPVEGRPATTLMERLSGELKIAVSTLIQRIKNGQQSAEFPCIAAASREHTDDAKPNLIALRAEALPYSLEERRHIHLTFIANPKLSAAPNAPASPQNPKPLDSSAINDASIDRIADLEGELALTRENLQATIEELQTINEELQASNEEMHASNEELQSTNEELQSVNEELYTVNAEYTAKNDELIALNAEHQILLESVSVGIVFVDANLRIRKFNSAIQTIIKLLPQDVGRPLDHLNVALRSERSLMDDAATVLRTKRPLSEEIETHSGHSFLKQIFPVIYNEMKTDGVVISFSDITAFKRSQNLLAQSEERLNAALEDSRQGLWEFRFPSNDAFFSDSWFSLLGFQRNDLKLSFGTWLDTISPEDRILWKRKFQKALQSDAMFSIECRALCKDGSSLWLMCRGKVRSRDAVGRATRVLGIITDISEQKKLESDLRETERRLELSLQSAEQVWWDWHLPSKKLVTHGVDYCILGYDCFEVQNTEDFWWSRVPPSELDEMRLSLEQHFAGRSRVWRSEHRYRDKNGVYRWVIDSGQVIERDAQNNPVRMIGVTQLNHQRKVEQLELLKNRQLYRSIVEDQAELICRCDADHTVQFANLAFAAFFNAVPEDIIDRSWESLVGNTESVTLADRLSALSAQNPVRATLTEYKFDDDKRFFIQWTDRAIFDESNTVLGFQSVGHDLTAAKESELKLRRLLTEANTARENAESANRAKSEFLAVMNHELRTPLNPIIAGSEILADTVESQEELSIAKMINDAGKNLLDLINSVLDLSKIESQRMTPVFAPFSIRELCESVTAIFSSTASGKAIEFKVSIDDAVPAQCVSDPSMLRQVLMNILSNALKFTSKGHVYFSLNYTPDPESDKRGSLLFSIEDSGIGIPAHLHKKVFEPFTQVDYSVTRKFGGTGIGLTISNRLVQLLDGRIELKSAPLKGSIFTITIPISIPEVVAPSKDPQGVNFKHDLHNVSVMIVDDDKANRTILSTILSKVVGRISVAADGIDAMEQFAAQPVDLIVMDVHMPNLNGFQAATRILNEHQDKPTQPEIIFLSADNRSINEDRAKAFEGTTFLAKPVRPLTLIECIWKLCGKPKS